jgi:hypothetical protein
VPAATACDRNAAGSFTIKHEEAIMAKSKETATNPVESTNPRVEAVPAIISTSVKGNGGIAPVTVGPPDEADDLAIDQAHLEEYANSGSESVVVECEKPTKGHFFTVRPETGKPYKDRAFYFLLQMEGRDPYLVAPKIAEQKKEEDTIRPVLIVRYVTMAGEEGLWPLKLNPPDGKSNNWKTSALNILELAESGKWVRIASSKKHYRPQVSKKTFKEVPPKFTDRTFKDLIDIAFKDRIVKTLDHEIWDVLEDGSDK